MRDGDFDLIVGYHSQRPFFAGEVITPGKRNSSATLAYCDGDKRGVIGPSANRLVEQQTRFLACQGNRPPIKYSTLALVVCFQ